MLVLKRNQVIAVCLAILVATAGYLNFSYRAEQPEDVAKETVGEIHLVENEPQDYFEAARLEREISRATVQETLASIIEDENSEAQSKAKAEEEKIKTAKQSDTETTIESLIRAKGYKDAVVYINDKKVDAVIKSSEMTSEDATLIAGIITEQTGIPATDIKISCAE